MSEITALQIFSLIGAAVTFVFAWMRMHYLEKLKSALSEQGKIRETLRQVRSESLGEFWTLTGAVNLFGPRRDVALDALSQDLADWYFKSGEALPTDCKGHYFLIQEVLGLCVGAGLDVARPKGEMLLGQMHETDASALERLDLLRGAVFGPDAERLLKTANRIDDVTEEELRAVVNVWRGSPDAEEINGYGVITQDEKVWLLIQWLMSLMRTRVRAMLGRSD